MQMRRERGIRIKHANWHFSFSGMFWAENKTHPHSFRFHIQCGCITTFPLSLSCFFVVLAYSSGSALLRASFWAMLRIRMEAKQGSAHLASVWPALPTFPGVHYTNHTDKHSHWHTAPGFKPWRWGQSSWGCLWVKAGRGMKGWKQGGVGWGGTVHSWVKEEAWITALNWLTLW